MTGGPGRSGAAGKGRTGPPGKGRPSRPSGPPRLKRVGRPQPPPAPREDDGLERLQKVLASAGLGSRRECESLITEGRVEVDGRPVQELGVRVDPQTQTITLDGEPLSRPRLAYYALNKPEGVVCTARDPSGRPRATDLLPPSVGRVFSVGRLDMASEGLLLLTNDGELANGLTHPRHGVEKTYQVQVAGHVTVEELIEARKGVYLSDGVAHFLEARVKSKRKQSTLLEVVLNEGKNREIRRVMARLGHKVQRLKRIAVGPVRLGEMPSGAYRVLTRDEVRALKAAVAAGPPEPAAPLPRPRFRPRPKPTEGPKSATRTVLGVADDAPAASTPSVRPSGRPKGRYPTSRRADEPGHRAGAAGRSAGGKPTGKPPRVGGARGRSERTEHAEDAAPQVTGAQPRVAKGGRAGAQSGPAEGAQRGGVGRPKTTAKRALKRSKPARSQGDAAAGPQGPPKKGPAKTGPPKKGPAKRGGPKGAKRKERP